MCRPQVEMYFHSHLMSGTPKGSQGQGRVGTSSLFAEQDSELQGRVELPGVKWLESVKVGSGTWQRLLGVGTVPGPRWILPAPPPSHPFLL